MAVVYILISLIVVMLVTAALLPARYHMEHTAVIKSSVETVIDIVADLNYFAKWNPWQLMETNGIYDITGYPKTVGHKYSWKGKKTGMGSLTIGAIEGRHVHFDLEFIRPWKSKARDNWFFEEWGNGETKVTWQNNGELPFPIARLIGKMILKNLNNQFVIGLNNLKQLCEKY